MTATTHHAIVLPAEISTPHRVIDWPYPSSRATLDLLYREIGCECVDASPSIPTPFGTLTYWVDDEGLFAEPVRHNDRGIALMRSLGYHVPDIAGTMVITGGADASGDTLGLPPRADIVLDQFLTAATTHIRARTAGWN